MKYTQAQLEIIFDEVERIAAHCSAGYHASETIAGTLYGFSDPDARTEVLINVGNERDIAIWQSEQGLFQVRRFSSDDGHLSYSYYEEVTYRINTRHYTQAQLADLFCEIRRMALECHAGHYGHKAMSGVLFGFGGRYNSASVLCRADREVAIWGSERGKVSVAKRIEPFPAYPTYTYDWEEAKDADGRPYYKEVR